jgi:CRP-like cAMP-binding protein
LSRAVVRRLSDGAPLASRGTPAENWCGVARGAVRVSSVSLSGKQVTLTYVPSPAPGSATSRCSTACRARTTPMRMATTTLLVVRKADFKDLLAQHVELYDALLRLNCRRLRLMFDQFEDLNTRPLQAAPGQAVAAAGKSYGIEQGDEIRIGLRWRRKTWRSCWARRASASTRSSRASSAKARCASSPRGWWCCRATSCSTPLNAEGPTLSDHGPLHRHQADGRRATPSTPLLSNVTWSRAARLCRPADVEQFKGGQSNPTYRCSRRARLCHAQQARAGAKLLPSAHAIEREFRVMSALALTACRCRDARAVRGRVGDRPRLLRDGVRRRPRAVGPVAAGHDRDGRGAIYDEMNRVIAALHSVDVRAAGLADYGKPGNYFERQIGRWSKQYQAVVTEPSRRWIG